MYIIIFPAETGRQFFVLKLRDLGYEDVKLIDTTNGRFMIPIEATLMGLSGSAILVGRK